MKIVFFTIIAFFLTQQQSNAAVVRKQPAFAVPFYSSSYLPAAMQVIFHAVDQLKQLEEEEKMSITTTTTTTTALPTTSPHAPVHHQPSTGEQPQSMNSTGYGPSMAYTASTMSGQSADFAASAVSTDTPIFQASTASAHSESSEGSTASSPLSDSTDSEASLSSAVSEASTSEVLTGSAASEESTASVAAINPTGSTPIFVAAVDDAQSPATSTDDNTEDINEEKPEVVEETAIAIDAEAETPEENYATPEINHEVQETVQEVTESNQEIAEDGNEGNGNLSMLPSLSGGSDAHTPATIATTSIQAEVESSEEESGEKSSSEESGEVSGEAKNKLAQSSSDEDGISEDEDDEIRFTLIGEKVEQVPRPSLLSHLRKMNRAPLGGSLEELATLYDALSKDARKQGYSQYSGYTDQVLETLQSSAEGGAGPQLRVLLEKTRERKEAVREDTKTKISNALTKLSDPASILSRDFRRLVPLRYIP